MVLKMLAWGVSAYARDPWSRFDAVVVTGSWLSWMSGVHSGLDILRIFRVFRILLLINRYKGLMALISTILRSLPSVVDLVMVTSIFVFIYAVIGMHMFGEIVPQNCGIECPGRYNNEDNFRDFLHACKLLMQTSTGQCHYFILHDLSKELGPTQPFIFFASYKFVSDFVLINLIVRKSPPPGGMQIRVCNPTTLCAVPGQSYLLASWRTLPLTHT